MDRAVNFQWEEQRVLKGSMRTEFYWEGAQGTGAAIASALRGWEHLRFEVTEDSSPGSDGGRWMHTPDRHRWQRGDPRRPGAVRDGDRWLGRLRAAP
jgi:hypothetical protein